MRLYSVGSVLALSTVMLFSACKENSEDAAAVLRVRLQQTAREGRFYYAHQDDLVYGHSWKVTDPQGDDLSRSDVLSVCGFFPAVVGFDLGGIELGDKANLDGVDFSLMRRAAVSHSEKGGIVTFSWHMRNLLTGGDSWDISSDKVVASVLPGIYLLAWEGGGFYGFSSRFEGSQDTRNLPSLARKHRKLVLVGR